MSEQERDHEPGHDHDHGRVNDDEGTVDFSRLITEIGELVALVERHEPGSRRAMFDAYVTAVTEFGATAAELATITVPDALVGDDEDDEATEMIGSQSAAEDIVLPPPSSPDRPRGRPAPRGARTSASQGRSGVAPVRPATFDQLQDASTSGRARVRRDPAANDADAHDAGPRIRRRRSMN